MWIALGLVLAVLGGMAVTFLTGRRHGRKETEADNATSDRDHALDGARIDARLNGDADYRDRVRGTFRRD